MESSDDEARFVDANDERRPGAYSATTGDVPDQQLVCSRGAAD
jgi:hypothetical protein